MALGAGALLAFGSGEEGNEQHERAIEAAIVDATTSTDPGICDQVFTDRWLASNFASETQSTAARCREVTAEEGSKADRAEVAVISLDGARATATATVTGGNVGRAELELALVESSGWRLDELIDIDVDRDRFLSAQREQVDAAEVHQDAEPLMRCMLDYADRAVSAAQIERSVLAGSESFYEGAFPSCVSEFRQMLFSPATIGANTDHTAAELRCIAGLAGRLISDSELRALFSAFARDEPSEDVLAEERNAAVAACTGGV